MSATSKTWFVTASGHQAFVDDAWASHISIEDIAHSLSMQCRFGGHTQAFYSVAQHSCLVSEMLGGELAMVGLLHDATEAYLGDVIKPLKVLLPEYERLERLWWEAIAAKFGLPKEMPPQVKDADRVALVTERRDLVAPHTFKWTEDEAKVQPHPHKIWPLGPHDARERFLRRFDDLGGER